jgi:hypothetical protein
MQRLSEMFGELANLFGELARLASFSRLIWRG